MKKLNTINDLYNIPKDYCVFKDENNLDEILYVAVSTGEPIYVSYCTLLLILLQLNERGINTLMVQQDKNNNYWIKVDNKTVEAYKYNLEYSNVEENNNV